MNLTISLGQMDVHAGQPDRNLSRVREWIAEAARRGSDLVVFPELWDTGYALAQAAQLGSPLEGGRFASVAALAREHRVHVIGSMLELAAAASAGASPRAYNTAVWFGPEGDVLGVYRKLHLFRLMNEERYLDPGEALLLLDLPWGTTGTAICYDLRFPELFRSYALGGAVLTVIPAQWPHPRMAHWQTLLRARAIENQMVVVACNRVGEEQGAKGPVRFGGRSVILDAWGEAVIEGNESETLLTATVDLSHVAHIRQRIPVFDDRRPDVYSQG